MSRPPVQRHRTSVTVSSLDMKDRKYCSPQISKALVTLLLLAAMSFLAACQGLSAGGTGIQATPGALGSSLASISFGNVTVGKKQTLSGTVTNTGGSSVSVSKVAISGAGFTLSGITSGSSLAAGQTAGFSVEFAPTTTGTSNGTLTVTSDASNATLSVPVSGSGTAAVGQLSANPTSLSFGSVTVGQNQSLAETITNSGAASVTISQIAISGSGFSLVGATSSVTLSAGQSTSFSVKFAPTSAGNATGSVTVTSDGANPTLTVSLSGTGAATPGLLSASPTSLSSWQCHCGFEPVAFRNHHEHWRINGIHLERLDQRDRIHSERYQLFFHLDRRAKHDIYREVRTHNDRGRDGKCDGDLECIEPDTHHRAFGHRGCDSGTVKRKSDIS